MTPLSFPSHSMNMELGCLFLVASCDDPTPANGKITYSSKSSTDGKYPVGSFVTINCINGFLVIGPNYRRCRENGTWSGAPTLCKGSNVIQVTMEDIITNLMRLMIYKGQDGDHILLT